MSTVINILTSLKQIGVKISLDDSGQNLKVRGNLAALSDELKVALKSNRDELIAFFKENAAPKAVSIPRSDRASTFALAPNQKGIWFHEKMENLGTAYVIPAVYFYELSDFNSDKFQKALEYIVSEHDVFRYIFDALYGTPMQEVLPSIDVSNHWKVEPASDDADLERKIVQRNATPLPSSSPLWELVVYQLPNASYCFFLRIHHLIGDGESLNVFIQKLIHSYMQLKSGNTLQPSDMLQYQDYAAWISDKDNFESSTAFWKNEFEQYSEDFHLNAVKVENEDKYNSGHTYIHTFSLSLTASLRKWSQNNRVSLASFYTAVSAMVLSQQGNSDDFVVGIPTASRSHPQLTGVIGNLVNTLPLRLKVDRKLSPKAFVAGLQQSYLSILEHQLYPFEYILEAIDYQRKSEGHPLFNVMVSVPNNRMEKASERQIEFERNNSLYDLAFTFVEREDTTELVLEYATHVFDQARIKSMAAQIEWVAKQLVNDTLESLEAISLATEGDKAEVLAFNDTEVDFQTEHSLIELFEDRVEKSPNNTAIIHRDTAFTYEDLNTQANQLAHYIQSNYKLLEDDLVGIKLDRGASMVIAMLAVMKTGAAYLPIDSKYPQERIAFIQDNSNCKFILDEKAWSNFEASKKSWSTENVQSERSLKNLSYVLYTSGTTGNPKGIMVENEQLLNYVQTFIDYFGVSETDAILSQSTIAFDTSVEEIYPVLVSGGQLVIADDNRDFEALIQLCETHKITLFTANPFAIHYLNEVYESRNLSLRTVISGGDVLKMDSITNLYKKVAVYNTYGPTETTVCATYYKVNESQSEIPIGSPIANSKVYILDGNKHLVPAGVLGTIYIGGAGVTRGYLNNDSLTNEQFVPNPFGDGKIYNTGDLGAWKADGTILFYGRKDNQVSLRGFRIELEEIETALLQFSEDIKEAVVTITEIEGEKHLVAYYCASGDLDKKALRSHLRSNLVYYMVPTYLKAIDSVPITLNGKVDVEALPKITEADLSREAYTAPKTEEELQLTAIWKEVLQVEKIGTHDNFFEFGGNSLHTFQVLHRIRKEFNVELDLDMLYQRATVAEIAKEIEKINWVNTAPEITDTNAEIEKFSI